MHQHPTHLDMTIHQVSPYYFLAVGGEERGNFEQLRIQSMPCHIRQYSMILRAFFFWFLVISSWHKNIPWMRPYNSLHIFICAWCILSKCLDRGDWSDQDQISFWSVSLCNSMMDEVEHLSVDAFILFFGYICLHTFNIHRPQRLNWSISYNIFGLFPLTFFCFCSSQATGTWKE